MRRFLQSCAVSVAVFLFVFCPGAFAASILESRGALDFTYDLQSMIRLDPDFSTYPGSNGIIWLKQLDYRNSAHGGIERRSLWVILGRKGLESRWLNWNIPTPQGGASEILEASVYAHPSGKKIRDVAPTELSRGEGGGYSVSFTDLPNEFILVVSYRESFPQRLSIDDLVWISETLPVWEGLIGITVPADYPFHYTSNAGLVPQNQKIGNNTLHEWRAINTPPDARLSLRTDKRAYVAFGMREGRDVAARFIKNLGTTAVPSMPAAARNLVGRNPDAKSMGNLLKWIQKQPEFVLPDCTLREIPAEAPWTDREKVLLAWSWLKNAGADVRLTWRLAYSPDTDEPVCESMAVSPVLEISNPDPKKEPYFYDMKYPPRFGENPVSLQGQMVYSINPDGKITERKVPGSVASENRLSAVFDLYLKENGIMGGTIRIQARSAWRHFLLPANPSHEDLVSLLGNLFPLPLRYSDVKLQESTGGGEIVVTLTDTQAITGTGGRNILVTLPALIPGWFKNLTTGPYPYVLHFPFILDAKITLSLPESVANVMLPTPAERDMGKIKYTDSFKLSKKKVLSAEARLVAATGEITENNASNLNSALQGWHIFMTRNLPVQLKVKK